MALSLLAATSTHRIVSIPLEAGLHLLIVGLLFLLLRESEVWL